MAEEAVSGDKNFHRSQTKQQTYNSSDFLRGRGYIVRNTAGEGTYSKVKRACSVVMKRDVAIKVISLEETPEVFRQRFLPRELDVLSVVHHPNIVKTYEIFQTRIPSIVFIVTEFMHCGDLLDHVKDKGAVDEATCRCIFTDVCRAVEYLHSNSIVHRDIKCENILLDLSAHRRPGLSFVAKLCDFGFARRFSKPDAKTEGSVPEQNCSSTFCGSVAYASPEILDRKQHNPTLADVWALGIVFFITTFGSMPFDDTNVRQMVEMQKRNIVVSKVAGKVGRMVASFIQRALTPDPEQRPTVEQLLQHKWILQRPAKESSTSSTL